MTDGTQAQVRPELQVGVRVIHVANGHDTGAPGVIFYRGPYDGEFLNSFEVLAVNWGRDEAGMLTGDWPTAEPIPLRALEPHEYRGEAHE